MKAQDLFTSVFKAANSAVEATRSAFKIPNDPSLALYGKLDIPDFEYIKSRYGMDGLADYVKEMEYKKLRGG